jgi:hypothetical protein
MIVHIHENASKVRVEEQLSEMAFTAFRSHMTLGPTAEIADAAASSSIQ